MGTAEKDVQNFKTVCNNIAMCGAATYTKDGVPVHVIGFMEAGLLEHTGTVRERTGVYVHYGLTPDGVAYADLLQKREAVE